MPTLQPSEIQQALQALPGWRFEEDAITREFTFASFPDAVAFVVRVAFGAEAADHHPDISIHYRRVTLRYWTHTEKGVTRKDIEGARRAEACVFG